MEFLTGILMILCFFVVVIVIMKGESPIIMLLLLALAWALLAGVPGKSILANVIEKGGLAYASTIVVIIFGAWFGQTLVKTGIAESIIRGAIELAGDRPIVVTMVVTVVTSLLFISLYGVGAAIALGVIALPIMMSMGVPPQVAAASYVMAIGAGTFLNLVDFNIRAPLFPGIKYEGPLLSFFAAGWVVYTLAALAMIFYNLKIRGGVRKYSAVSTVPPATARPRVSWYAYLSPAVPVVMVIFLKWPMIPAFILGVAYALLSTHFGKRTWRETIDLFHRSFYDAFPEIATIAALWIICGMLIIGGQLPEIQKVLKPIYSPFLPESRAMLTIFFIALTPLAIYRGPLHVVGTGAALIGMFLNAKTFPVLQLFAAWRGDMAVGSSMDPTNSWTLWTIGYTKITHKQYLATGFPWAWLMVAVVTLLAYYMIP
jgi:Mg2+/citrate symporter